MTSRITFQGDATAVATPSKSTEGDTDVTNAAHLERIAYSPAEVAEMIGVSTQTVYRMIQRGDIDARKVGTRNYRILAKDVDAYLDRSK